METLHGEVIKNIKIHPSNVNSISKILTTEISIFSPLMIPFVLSRDSKRGIVKICF